MRYTALIAAFPMMFAAPALAESSLGVTGVALSFGSGRDASVGAFGEARADVAITQFHGAQFDIGLEDLGGSTIGTLGLHLYMTPRDGQKYGVFAVVGDEDGRSATYGMVGAEGLFGIDANTAVEIRGGLGLASHSDLDFLFLEADLYTSLSADVEVYGGVTLSEFDEVTLSATGYEARFGVALRRDKQPWGFFAEIAQDGLHGLEGSRSNREFRIGLTVELGNVRRGGRETRLLRSPDPLRPLVTRGLF